MVNSNPIFFLSFYEVVGMRLEKDSEDSKKIPLMKGMGKLESKLGEVECGLSLEEQRRLDVRDIQVVNLSLLAKWR